MVSASSEGVRRILRGERSDVFRVRESSLETYLPWLDLEGQRDLAMVLTSGNAGSQDFVGPYGP
jgi:hypothetical protein